jgi:uncharacterized protein (TIGR03000 family)
VKKFLSLAVVGVAAAALTLATPAVSSAGWHGGGHYHSYHYRGYGYGYGGHSYWGHNYWGYRHYYVTPSYYCAPAPLVTSCIPATIRVAVPCEAKVWIDGQATCQSGANRVFESPPLAPGKEFTYTVKAEWRGPDGKNVCLTRQVDIQANACVDVDLRQ